MDIVNLPLDGLKLVRPKVFRDERGFFLESFREETMRAAFGVSFAQDNHSRSTKHIVRGLHFQTTPGQAKLVRVGTGRIFDVAVDIRPQSKTFGQWHGEILDDDTLAMMFIPVGFAHGFCVLSDVANVFYKCSSVYDAKTESGFLWNDADVNVAWPLSVEDAVVSQRDQQARTFAQLKSELRA